MNGIDIANDRANDIANGRANDRANDVAWSRCQVTRRSSEGTFFSSLLSTAPSQLYHSLGLEEVIEDDKERRTDGLRAVRLTIICIRVLNSAPDLLPALLT